jgi:peptidoglycan/LPS O-acetylase OafA/YrhL
LLLYVLVRPINQSIWYNTFTRLDPIALGILLALLLRTKRISLGGLQRMLLLCVSLSALVAVAGYAHLNWNSQPISVVGLFGYPIVALGCSGIVLAILGISTHIFRNAALIYLGKISYGLYVYHVLGVWIAERLFGTPHGSSHIAAALAADLCFIIVLASVSYHFLELPFLRWKKQFTYVPSRPL